MSPTLEKETLESAIHRLKLQWVMAKDDAERASVSEEIRKRLGVRKAT